MRIRFSQDDVDLIGQAMTIDGKGFSAWARDTLVAQALRTIKRHKESP